MEIVHSTEVYQSESSKGLAKFWQGHIGNDGDNWYTLTSYWQETKTGLSKKTTSAPTLVHGKNIGKANETTDKDQAESELTSMVNKQKDKGYHLEGEQSSALLLPQLCLKLKDAQHRLTGRIAVQPKLDGTRQLWDSKTSIMWSRGGKPQKPQIYHHLKFDTQGYIADGELILPAPYTFQQTLSATKRFQMLLSPKLQYHVFDIADPTGLLTFEERYEITKKLVADANNPNIILVPTYILNSVDEIMDWQDKFVEMGYEGIIVRMLSGKYKPGNKGKSHEIQKFKYFIDAEYEVVGISDGNGKNEGLAKFICKHPKKDVTFNVDFNGTDTERRYMFNNPDEFIGRMLTVKFQEYTDDDVPRFGKGISFRDYDLQGGGEDEED